MQTFRRSGVAIVIEGQKVLSDVICEFLNAYGYEAIQVDTHAAGHLHALTVKNITLLAACVPAPDEARAQIYLAEANKTNTAMAVVLMLNDPLEPTEGAPEQSVRVTKPFDSRVLVEAITASESLLYASHGLSRSAGSIVN